MTGIGLIEKLVDPLSTLSAVSKDDAEKLIRIAVCVTTQVVEIAGLDEETELRKAISAVNDIIEGKEGEEKINVMLAALEGGHNDPVTGMVVDLMICSRALLYAPDIYKRMKYGLRLSSRVTRTGPRIIIDNGRTESVPILRNISLAVIEITGAQMNGMPK